MYKIINYILVVFLLFLLSIANSQAVFQNSTKQFKKKLPTRSIMPGGCLDMDGDLIDDLVILDKGQTLKILKSNGKHFGLSILDSIKTTPIKEWTLTAGDLQNDGRNEIITSGEYNLSSITALNSNLKLSKRNFITDIYAQASNTIDINNDGWLDYFLCNDDGPNKIYLNDGNGNLKLAQVINFMENDTTDGSGNYGSEWVDINGDLLPDLCISKCRAGVNDPTDKRRVNRLYINKGNANFEESGTEFGLNSGKQSWVTAFGDLDNDGDMDAFVVNHYASHALMENIEGKFYREVTLPSELNSFSFQAVMRDFDNDGLLDILLAGVEGTIYLHNRGNLNFEVIKKSIGSGLVRSFTCGDFNDDGFLDIHAHMGEPINDVGLQDDELWLNLPNGFHFYKFNLIGTTSNASAIAAQIEIYGKWGKQMRYVKGGESYGIFNSLQQHFGIGSATTVDSVIVRWPSGIVDKITEALLPDQTYYFQEGKCYSSTISLYEDILIKKDTLITLEAPATSSYVWSQGSTTKSIQVTEGVYHVRMTNDQGCVTVSKPIVVVSGCFPENVKLIDEISLAKKCFGDSIEVFGVAANTYQWSDGSTNSNFKTSESGVFSLISSDYCGNVKKDSFEVVFIDINLNVKGDTIVKGQKAILTSDKKNTLWFEGIDLINPIHIGDTLVTNELDNTTIFRAKALETIDQKTGFIGEKNFPTSNFYGNDNTAGGLTFNVEKNCIIRAIKVNTDTEGNRRIIIKNNQRETIFSKDIKLIPGISRVELDARLEVGSNYTISTDTEINKQNLGFNSPRLVRTLNNTSYPYSIESVIEILSSTFGAIYFYYFYDWEIQFETVSCESSLKEVLVFVEKDVDAIDRQIILNISIFPNPTLGNFRIISDHPVYKIKVFDLNGRELLAMESDHILEVDTDDWKAGVYIIKLYTLKGETYRKVTKICRL